MSLATPAQVLQRLEEIDADLAIRQNEMEEAAFAAARAKLLRERRHAEALLSFQQGTVAEKKAKADLALADDDLGVRDETRYDAMKRIVGILETRATIWQSALRSQGRA